MACSNIIIAIILTDYDIKSGWLSCGAVYILTTSWQWSDADVVSNWFEMVYMLCGCHNNEWWLCTNDIVVGLQNNNCLYDYSLI